MLRIIVWARPAACSPMSHDASPDTLVRSVVRQEISFTSHLDINLFLANIQTPTSAAITGIAISQTQLCKMPLVVQPVEHQDVTQCVDLRVASLGSLVIGRPPPYAGYVEAQESSLHKEIDNSSHVRHRKVVDTENEEEVLASAKWEVYEHGRPDLEKLRAPMQRSDREVDEFGLLREAAHDYFCRRNGEMGKHPHLRESSRQL